MPNLYTMKEKNIQRSWLFLFFFFLIIVGLGYLFALIFESIYFFYGFLGFAILLNVVSVLGSSSMILSLTKAKPIEKKDNPELYRLTENLCITAGLPMPKIYVMNVQQPNAFVTGLKAEKSILVVTSGLLNKLEKVELEGVIAHELSHIGNRDIFLATVIVVLVGTIVLLADMGIRLGFGSRREKGGAPLFLIAIVAYILSFFLARLLQMAISRQREFLADASAALLTRYPEGLARALEKISADPNPIKTNHSTAHLYISSPFRGREKRSWMTRAFSTHPPVEDRINRLRNLKI
jgi:heat shock protein HtpX